MQLKTNNYGITEQVFLPSQLVMSNAADVRKQIRNMLEEGTVKLILDLSEVEFCDSSGLSVLVSSLKIAEVRGGEVVLLKPTDDVRILIELTRLHLIFEIFEDQQSAIRHFA